MLGFGGGNAMSVALFKQLDRRNECAHPSNFFPDLNVTLGYVTELVDRVRRMTPP